MSLKDQFKAFEKEFIPGGGKTDITKLKFRKTNDNEILRCCAMTGSDPQSGPYYCGHLAEYVADVIKDGKKVGRVALCPRKSHRPPDNLIVT